jgi:flagellin-like protein
MNVFGKNERSWRKARKRGVSPIIATILLVAITVVLAAVLYVLISGLTGGGVGSKPIGSAFNAGNPVSSKSSATGGVGSLSGGWTGTGCVSGDYCYTLTVESSTITFTSALFEVKTTAGTIYSAGAGTGGFSIVNIGGGVVAQSAHITISGGLAMTSPIAIFNSTAGACNSASCVTSSPLTSIYTVVIDMGTSSPSGLGLTFVAVGTGSYSGTTAPVLLP